MQDMNNMEEVLYNLMDWAEIEAVVYSEHDDPHHLLGPHVTEHGVLINAFFPNAAKAFIMVEQKAGKSKGTKTEYQMVLEDEAGFFAILLPGKQIPSYTLKSVTEQGETHEFYDPYSFAPVITEADQKSFAEGIHYNIYEKLGAHPMTIHGIEGTLFAVWAPNCIRVSVTGNFNSWDGRRHPMRKLGSSGIFELFVPGIATGSIYKYELKAKGGLTYLKSDPYANYAELRPNTASVVYNLNTYKWNDEKWLSDRKKKKLDKEPMTIYEVHLGSWKKPAEKDSCFYNYRELAPMISEYVQKMGYTHIELMPVMEHPLDASWGYQVTGYYAATARYGTPDDFMYFIDYMHKSEIGVILDWVPAHFPRDTFGLSNFDGTCLYEHKDPRQGSHPHWGTLIYNYGSPQVANFLIANALFWVEKYHADGIRMDAVASMLYLDYGKNDGEWVANEYGGNENIEAMNMLKHLNTVFTKQNNGSILIAEESTSWPMVTDSVEKGGLGFKYKWNMGWMNDFTNYMKQDPLFRKGWHGALTFSMVYAYSEKFILVLSHDEVVHGKASMVNKMPGTEEQKFANLRAAYGYMTAHPGKKLLFMGQEFAQKKEWNEQVSLEWGLLEQEPHKKMADYTAALNHLYRSYPALYQEDYNTEGFSWVSALDADHSIISFMRYSEKKQEKLFVICNFTPIYYEKYVAAVPYEGKYKEIFNSDDKAYGGQGFINPRVKQSKSEKKDGLDNTLTFVLPPFGFVVFSCHEEKITGTVTAKKVSQKNDKKTNSKEDKKTAKSTDKIAEAKKDKKASGSKKTDQ